MYDVTYVKMHKNAHKYLAFPSVNFFESLYSSRQRLYLSNFIFPKNPIKQIFLNVKKYHFRNKELKGSSPYLHLRKLIKIITEGNARIYRKSRIFWTRCYHGNDLQKVNNNKHMIVRMLLISLENFVNKSHNGGKLGFLEHFSPI